MNIPRASLSALREELQNIPAPIILFNKSHSGSRLLARLVEASGVFMGAHQNESKDSLDLLELVQYLVLRHYPDYSRLWTGGDSADPGLAGLVRDVFARHWEGFDPGSGGPWGWKLCETVYIVPFLDYLFPRARYIHLIRDGRDVAFCDHTGPSQAFWKKVYFGTDRINAWRGYSLTGKNYRKRRHVFNAAHWVSSVQVGLNYGAMLRERCLEVRYEDLCLSFRTTARRVQEFLGLGDCVDAVERLIPDVHGRSIHKFMSQPRRKQRSVMEIAKPLLLSLGYLTEDP
jgi:hypothetical protein